MNLAQTLSRSRPAWWTDAACTTPVALKLRAAGRADWFPERGRSSGAARRICADCPVRRQCLDAAMADRSLQGIRGGLSDAECRRLRGGS